jgi:hypothetical protein
MDILASEVAEPNRVRIFFVMPMRMNSNSTGSSNTGDSDYSSIYPGKPSTGEREIKRAQGRDSSA